MPSTIAIAAIITIARWTVRATPQFPPLSGARGSGGPQQTDASTRGAGGRVGVGS